MNRQKLNLTQMQTSGMNSRNHAGVGAQYVQQYNQWFRDTLRVSNTKIAKTIATPSRTHRGGQALQSMETPSTIYTTPKHTPLTARGSNKLTDTGHGTGTARTIHTGTVQKHQQSNKTINDHAARNIL